MIERKKKSSCPAPSSEIKFLLGFANLGRKPGKLHPPTEQAVEKWKRKSDDIEKPDFSELKWRPCGPYWQGSFELQNGSGIHFRLTKATHAFDKKGNRWIKPSPEHEPVWAGKLDIFPEKEFYELSKKRRFPLQGAVFLHPEEVNGFKSEIGRKFKSSDLNEISDLWVQIRNFFYFLSSGKRYFCDTPLTELLNPEVDGHPAPKISVINEKMEFIAEPGDIYQTVVACFANFYLNQEKLHRSLRMCLACGCFWIKKIARKEQRKYCSSKCEYYFNLRSKEDDRKRQQDHRGKETLKSMIERLQKRPYNYSPKVAEEKAKEFIKKGNTLKDL